MVGSLLNRKVYTFQFLFKLWGLAVMLLGMNSTNEAQSSLTRMTRTIPETAEILGVSYHSVQRLIYADKLRTIPGLRTRLVPVKEIERFLELR